MNSGTEGIHVIETIEDNGTVVLKKPASAGMCGVRGVDTIYRGV